MANTRTISWIVPIHDKIILIIYRDEETGNHNAELMTNTVKQIMLVTAPEKISDAVDSLHEFMERIIEHVFAANNEISGEQVTLSFQVDTEVIEKVSKQCVLWQITIEELLQAFFRYCAKEENLPALKEWIEDYKRSNKTE